MNTVDLSKDLAQATGLGASKCEDIIKYLFNRITATIAKGETVKVYAFGHFSARQRQARVGHNPKDGTAVNIPEMSVAHWSVSVTVKDVLNKRKPVDELFVSIDPSVVKAQSAVVAAPAAPVVAVVAAPAAPVIAPVVQTVSSAPQAPAPPVASPVQSAVVKAKAGRPKKTQTTQTATIIPPVPGIQNAPPPPPPASATEL